MKRNGNAYRGCLETLLHNLMAASLPHSDESVLFQNATNFRARENSELPNGYLNLRHKDFAVKASGDFGRGRRLEEQRERLDKVGSRLRPSWTSIRSGVW